jgi:hypothetical protein
MHAIEGQQDQYYEVWNEKRKVEAVGLIQSLKCLVEKVSAQVMAQAVGWLEKSEADGGQDRVQIWLRSRSA